MFIGRENVSHTDLGSGGLNRGGSSPPFRTNKLGPIFDRPFFTFVPRFLSGHRSS